MPRSIVGEAVCKADMPKYIAASIRRKAKDLSPTMAWRRKKDVLLRLVVAIAGSK